MTSFVDVVKVTKFNREFAVGTDMRTAVGMWRKRYNDFTYKRYLRFSAGGGTWPVLKKKTIKQKRKGKAKILIRFKTLISNLKGTTSVRQKNWSISAGFTSNKEHYSGMTMDKLAAIHHFGLGRVPVRTILVRPPKEVVDKMKSDVAIAAKRAAKKSGFIIS